MNAPIDLNRIDQRDWFLQSLINGVNGQDTELGITLNIGGFLVSGQLVSGHKYFEGFGADLGSAFTDPEAKRVLQQSFERFGGLYTSDPSNEPAIAPPNYLHLKNARFFNTAGKSIPENRGVWWRGRVSEISGFFLGVLEG